jgi:hypothetical protein
MVGQASRGTGAANPGTRSRGNVPVAGPAGAAAEAQLGYWGTATALATTGGTYAAAQNLAEQGGEMIFGERDHIDWGLVAKAGAINAGASFVGGVVGGKFAGILGNSLGKFVGGLSPEVMQTFGIEGAQLLTNGERIFIQWLGNLASSPFQTSTTVLMQSALERKWTVTSTGDFLNLVLHDMLLNGWIGGFFSLAHAYTASRPAPGGTGPGDGGGGDSGGGRGGPGGGGLRAAARRSEVWARRVRRARMPCPPTRPAKPLPGWVPPVQPARTIYPPTRPANPHRDRCRRTSSGGPPGAPHYRHRRGSSGGPSSRGQR